MTRLTHPEPRAAKGVRRVLHTVADVAAAYQLTTVAGEPGVDRPIRWVIASELPDPADTLRGGELVLSYGVTLRPGDGPGIAGYLRRLDRIGVAGLGFGVGPYHPDVPPALCDTADLLGLPVLRIGPQPTFEDLTIAISSSLLRTRAAEARRAADGLADLASAAVLGGRAQIVATLADLLSGWAVVIDRAGKPRFATGGARVHIDDAVAAARGYRRRVRHPGIHVQPIGDAGPQTPQLVLGIRPGQESLARELATHAAGLLELAARPSASTSLARQAGQQAIELLLHPRAEAVRTALERWGLPAEDLVVARLRSRSRAVFLAETAAGWVEQLRLPILLAGDGPTVTAVLPADTVPAWRSRVQAAVEQESLPVRCGLGTAVACQRLPASAAQATQALEIAIAEGRSIVSFDDLPASRLLLASAAGPALASRALAGLDQAGPQAGVLADSLRVFLAENGSWEAAAAQLGVHRHTLRRRIQRVEELTGRDLSHMEDRVELWVALRARGAH